MHCSIQYSGLIKTHIILCTNIFIILSRPKPTAESLAVLVLQAVHSDDRKLLDEVIRIDNKRVVDSTVRRLSITVIVPFLRTVSNGVLMLSLCVYGKCVAAEDNAWAIHLLNAVMMAAFQTALIFIITCRA